ncbi:MAG: PSD1 and planctomycete cytochrome C domain-containing protein [Rubripirellula sp.]|nr:PSD1 and planctomycete cytochrome C domain-containing protein [Rubripirellula sp.]
MSRLPLFFSVTLLFLVGGFCLAEESRPIGFSDEVQPILRRHCYRCHGLKNQEAGLQLNRRDSALSVADSDETIVVPGDAKASLLIHRIENDTYGDIMPPDSDPLSSREIEILRKWIEQGAAWPDDLAEPKHWAYQPIVHPEVHPRVKVGSESTAVNAIDYFTGKKLNDQGLALAESVDRSRLIRRASLALTGITPTPEEVAAFVKDSSADAYETVLDRLLQSPRYGERWAVPWLDLARYADSNGFQADQIRDNWAYRDWVIRAINGGLPFDQFVIDQLAGDLHDEPTIDQRVATGFHRMTTCNVEAGVHPEANRVNQVVDRVNTTATVFMGTTLECAQCHDHKYDPFTQADYYRVFAYFNNTPLEVKNTGGVTWDFSGPKMDLPLQHATQQRADRLRQRMQELRERRDQSVTASEGEFASWLSDFRDHSEPDWTPLVPEAFQSSEDEQYAILDDGAVLLTGRVPDTVEHVFTLDCQGRKVSAIRIEALTDQAIPGKGPGRGDARSSNIILSEVTCELIADEAVVRLDLENAVADFSQKNWDVSNAIDGNRKTGWAISPQFGKPHWASFVLSEPTAIAGSERLRVTLGQFYGRGRVIGKPRLSIYSGDPRFLDLPPSLRKLATKKKLNAADQKKLRTAFEKNNPILVRLDAEIAGLEKQLNQLKPDTTLVMVELDQPRETSVMIRGDYEKLGLAVKPGTPAFLPDLGNIEQTGNRMEFARWLTSPRNPLLARVTVNRWWTEIFGAGLVRTPEDFGTQGEEPSHPDLLDWLAAELISSGWSRKHIHKLMVFSMTFRQSARVTPDLLELDPQNYLLSRGPRFRLAAELLRDNALAISGLLSDSMYGPPIMPYQPENIWRSVGRNQPKWKAAVDADRFRRGVYVVWKRAAPYPSFISFDAPDRGSCTVNRGRSNTPQQALTLLNDPAYTEMSLSLADRILAERPDSSDQERIDYGFRLAVARAATTYEISVVRQLLEAERERLRANPALIQQRAKPAIDAMQMQTTDRAELAAWFAVANALLNLDETMSQ